jgi:hypothetical protein
MMGRASKHYKRKDGKIQRKKETGYHQNKTALTRRFLRADHSPAPKMLEKFTKKIAKLARPGSYICTEAELCRLSKDYCASEGHE